MRFVLGFLLISFAGSLHVMAEEIITELPSSTETTTIQEDDISALNGISDAINSNNFDYSQQLEAINDSIRELIIKEDKLAIERKTELENRNLAAQEQIAEVAEPMYWVAISSSILTLIGLLLLAGTLHFTRKAAHHSEIMKDEAEKTTLAALETVEINKAALEAETRPRIKINLKNGLQVQKQTPRNIMFIGDLLITNVGNTPANSVSIGVTLHRCNSEDAHKIENEYIGNWTNAKSEPNGFRSIFPGDSYDTHRVRLEIETPEIIEESYLGLTYTTVAIRVKYISQNGTQYMISRLMNCPPLTVENLSHATNPSKLVLPERGTTLLGN